MSLEDLALQLEVVPARLAELIDHTCARLPQQGYYVYRLGADRHRASGLNLPRTIAAFPTPDDALAFAQRNGYAMSAQLRAVSARELVCLLLRDPNIATVLFLHSVGSDESARGFPPGLTLSRQFLLDTLADDPPPSVVLSAKAFDALQFGVDFGRRGAFRAALTEAVEAVVADYVPPPGSLDHGPRSVFATTAVEVWLRANGFPHATQRRWITVADQAGWNGAEELCELDCGTQQRLLVQLLIHSDGKRQYIGRVLVTS